MKPISLSIKGLHSFREEQVIDFESLCDSGVFGIFGPTGSGKSSILDAMTLALYGKVERASNNTHGILNHAEDELAVSFTFKLQTGHETAYKVERVFKRTDDVKVKTSICRFIEMKEEQTVLADKASEVNRKVEELLGLTIDDFTRAVVLPQGKFAEFLSLKGADRRQMLQRLFNLEQYGDRLVKKLKKQAQAAYAKKNEMLAEQAGLGDADKEALKRAEKHLGEAEQTLEKKRIERDSSARHFTECQEIWNLQKEKEGYLREEEELLAHKDAIAEKERRLTLAETANTLKPYADAYLDAKEDAARAEEEEKQARKELQTYEALYEKAQHEYENFRNGKKEKEPELLKQEEQLTALKEIEKKRLAVQREADRKLSEKALKEDEIKRATDELQKVKSLLERGMTRQNQLKAELKAVQVSSVERKNCQTANQLAFQIKQRKQETEREQERLYKQKDVLSRLHKEEEQIKRSIKAEEEHIQAGFSAVERAYAMVCDAERALSETVNLAAKKRDELSAKREAAKTEELTKELAKQLKKGEPCPVCGSILHEKPAHFNGESVSFKETEEALREAENIIQEAAELAQEFLSAKVALEQQSDHLINECPFLTKNEPQLPETAASLEESSTPERFRRIGFEWRGIRQDLTDIKSRMPKLLSAYKETAKKREQIRERIGYEEKEKERLETGVKELSASLSEMETSFGEQFDGLSYEQAETWQKSIEEKDLAAEDYEKRIEKSVGFLKEQEQQKGELTERLFTLDKEQLDLHYVIEGLKKEIGEYEKELKDYPHAAAIDEHLEDVKTQLKELNEREQVLYEHLKETDSRVNRWRARTNACELAVREAAARLAKASGIWTEKAEGTMFEDAADVKKHLIGQEELERLKKDIQSYWDHTKQFKSNMKRIEEKLGGRSLTAEEWEKAEKRKVEAEEAFGRALEERGAAVKALHVMRENHNRFKELEASLKEWQTYIDRLDKLQAVFKGNSFVEYLAEEQLESVTRDASARLGGLTRQRYAIEVDSEGGFVMRDDANGGVRRPVTSLSGGETFLTSLALALALSAQIQLRGKYPLQFFFLDEGFGTLDQDLLDTVITALEKLQSDNLSVGVISHVQELRARLPKKLIVRPAEPSGRGTAVSLEMI
ncbi:MULTISPECIES: exonuclease subunit SbcC [Bacillus]|uniref:Nuclease SbcCD subunit C n=1 Tax=Bacillus glycinifermentans TaxID=1664069 RepID=A0AAJ3YW93_9BACI|nr:MULTISPECIES: exonuclease subunit SbcC [Bacillus]KKB73420.1 nuclease SbcCD subunit C [Bacillus sp. TH008]MDU0069631.1 exonuclease subunit SbcC [Bacillus sp. IG6]MED8017390.1 SMC family ATPase [Bacillus glycinifermentans]NUJ17057.1 SMC family ATPase [Bacillus glycinifermentans]QAT64547.1 SMC family ATPase [Bacillus glycinifermentans]